MSFVQETAWTVQLHVIYLSYFICHLSVTVILSHTIPTPKGNSFQTSYFPPLSLKVSKLNTVQDIFFAGQRSEAFETNMNTKLAANYKPQTFKPVCAYNSCKSRDCQLRKLTMISKCESGLGL